MAIFSDKIVDAYYSDPELKFIEILYEADEVQKAEGIELLSHHLSVDEEDPQYNDLLKEWSLNQIDEATKARNEQYRDEFRIAFHNYATEHGLYQHGNVDTHNSILDKNFLKDTVLDQASIDIIFDFDPDNEVHKEQLFKLKLKMFEQTHVDESKSRKNKTELRKAETPLDAIVVYSQFKK